MTPGLPYKRLGAFYLFWFGSLGALLPYWSLFLRDAGHSAERIGWMFAILMGTKMVAPNVWGWVADHHGHRLRIIRLATGVAAVFFLGMPFVDPFWALALLMVGYGFFANAALPQFEAVTFNHLGTREREYGRIRLWGSVGFIGSVLVLGRLLDIFPSTLVPWWILAALTGLFAVALSVPDPGDGRPARHGERLRQVLKRPQVASLLAVCFLVQFSHGPYYAFFSIYMEGHGYTRGTIGVLWALGVIAEIGVFAMLPQLIDRFGLRGLMLGAVAATALRWSLLAAFPERAGVVVPAQVLHLASFGIHHGVAVSLVHRLFRGRLQGRGQALYSSLSFGAGGAVGSLCSGYVWAAAPPAAIYVMAAAAAGLAWLIALAGLRHLPGRA
ncbi:major facilitator superfamily protein [Salinisphaera sp. PC39]|uniref:MFS transporter n=1 Tax=Salinisphaera sp. PC39 TaxID=1304156 RepID=UPI00333F411C